MVSWLKIGLAFIFCLLPAVARAATPAYPCPTFITGWALSGSGPITDILWSGTQQQLYFIWNHTLASDYYPVPSYSVIQAFSQTPHSNWVQTFNYLVAPSYRAILLQEKTNCPVLQESGSSVLCNLETEDGAFLLATETGILISTENPACPSDSPGGFIWVN